MNLTNKYLKAWLTFNKSPTDDAKGNQWTTYGNPTIGTANAINGNALQLDGQSYIKLSNIPLGGQNFEIDGWVYVDSNSPNFARLIHIVKPTNGYALVSLRKSSTDSTKLDFWTNYYHDVSEDYGYTYTADTNCVGVRVHFKLIYRYTDRILVLCINDKIVAQYTGVSQYDRQNFDIYIGALPNGNQGLIGSIDEIEIYDGTWYSYNYQNVPTASRYQQIYFNVDTKREIKNAPLTWRYENPGTADLLTVAGTTVTGLTESQSKTGTAFYQPTRAKCFDIPNTKEIWIKCDIFTTANYTPTNGDRIRIYSEDSNGLIGWCTFNSSENYALWHNGTRQYGSNYLGKNKSRSILLHMISDATNGVVEYFFPSGDTDKFVGNVNNGNDFANVYIQMDGSNILVSNLIISNAPLDIDEDVAELRQNAVEAYFDTLRSISNLIKVAHDTERKVIKSEEINFSTIRDVLKSVNYEGDTEREIYRTIELNFDTARDIYSESITPITENFDVVRNIVKAISADNDTARKIIKSLLIDFDTARNVKQAWRYENYGSADLLAVEGETVELSKSDAIYQSGFITTAARQNYFDIPAVKEIWIKFDFYFNNFYETLFVGSLDNEKTNQVRLNCTGASNDYAKIIFALSENVQSDTSHQFNHQQKYSAVLHLKSDETNGLIELTVSDGHNLTYTGNVNNGNDFENVYIQGSNYNSISSYPYVSNVIISNREVGINENTKRPITEQYDLKRLLSNVFTFQADTLRNAVWVNDIFADTKRIVNNCVNSDIDTCLIIQKTQQIDCDTARIIPHKVGIMPVMVESLIIGDLDTDTVIVPVIEGTDVVVVPSTENVTAGTQSIEINLSAQQLTDQISYTSVNPAAIMEQIWGQYLDYKFDVRIEKIRRNGVLYSCQCCSDIDEILYKQMEYKISEDEEWHRTDGKDYNGVKLPENETARQKALKNEPKVGLASTHIQKIAGILGKTPMLYFHDFVSTVDTESGGTTYQDLISSIFGWTSRIPTMMINVFLRDDKLFVIERGEEPNTIDLTNTKHTIPIVEQSLMRTAWGAKPWSKTETRERPGWRTYYDPIYDTGSSGGNSGSSSSGGSSKASGYEYADDGLVTQSTKEEGDTKIVTDYDYTTIGKKKYLAVETTTVYENGEVVDQKKTTHKYLGQGQTHSESYGEDGDYLGGVVNASRGNDKNTPYEKSQQHAYWGNMGYEYDEDGNKRYIEGYTVTKDVIHEERTVSGITLFDTSFPVHGDKNLAELTAKIIWLNRRTQERISMNIYDYPHLIDFTDRIIFEGNEYYLESNKAITTPRIINRQEVSFVRWF